MSAGSDICRAAGLIHRGTRVVAFTGAGLSTASGIPDFRSTESGLWSKQDPMEVASLSAFRFSPERFYEWARPVAVRIAAAEPNPAHLALAALESKMSNLTIITQNIDDLHRKAGSSKVIEIHGNFRALHCTGCPRTIDSQDGLEAAFAGTGVPRCPNCRSVLKPAAILFDEQLPLRTWQEAESACRTCDVMIVAGTSLEVHPAARLPSLAFQSGAEVITINDSPTPIDHRAAVAIRGRVEVLLPAIAAEVIAID